MHGMDLIPIGEAARRLRLSPSTLRYYDERGLVHPASRHGSRRLYGTDELRRLAFLRLMYQLGVSLDAAATVLDAPSPTWRQTVTQQIAALDQLIARATGARTLLTHTLHCPHDQPTRECSSLIATLDRLLEGTTFDQLAAEHTGTR